MRFRRASGFLYRRRLSSFVAVVEDLASFEVDDLGGEVSGVDEVQSQGLAGVSACGLDECFVVGERGVALLDGALSPVAVVAAAGWPVAVAFLAVVLQAGPHPFGEGGQGVAVPFLEGVAGEAEAGAAALVGQDGDLVDEVRVLGPAGRDDAGDVPDVLEVEPGDDVRRASSRARAAAAGLGCRCGSQGRGSVRRSPRALLLLGGAVGGEVQLPVGVRRRSARAAGRGGPWGPSAVGSEVMLIAAPSWRRASGRRGVAGQAVPSGFDEGGGGAGLRRDDLAASPVRQPGACRRPAGRGAAAPARPSMQRVQAGDDGFAVLGDDEGVPFRELADLGAGEDGDVFAGDGAAARLPGLPGGAGDPDGAEQVGDLLVEGDVLGAAEQDQVVGQAEQGAGFLVAEDRRRAAARSARPR